MILLSLSTSSRALLHQCTAAVTASLAVMMTGFILGWPSPTLPKLLAPESPIPLDLTGVSWAVALVYLGNMSSPIPCGCLMDRIGRKYTLLMLNILPFSGWLLILFTRTPAMLFLARYLSGLWIGIVYTVVPIYIGEIAEPRIRGSLSGLFQFSANLGILFQYIVGPYVSYNTLAIASGSVCIVFFLTFSWMPESPYYYVMKNKSDKAKMSLLWFRGNPTNVDEELYRVTNAVESQLKNKGTLNDLFFKEGNCKAFLIVGILSVLQRLSGIGAMIAFASTTFPPNALSFIGPSECVIILGVVWLVTTMVSFYFVEHYGRKCLLIISSLGCALAVFTAGLWFYLDSNTDIDVEYLSWIPFVTVLLHGVSFSIGIGPIPTTLKGEVFAANIKGIASALSSIMLAMCSFFVNRTYLVFAKYIGMYFNYWLYSLSCIVSAVFTITYVIETRGKTLQEIQDKLNRKNSTASEINGKQITKL